MFLGNGDGTFQSSQTFAVGNRPDAVAVADANGDGRPDLIVANRGSSTVSVLLGNGNGTFGPQQTYQTGGSPTSIAVGDLNGDGVPDLAIANLTSGFASVLLGNGNGTFQRSEPSRPAAPASIPSRSPWGT